MNRIRASIVETGLYSRALYTFTHKKQLTHLYAAIFKLQQYDWSFQLYTRRIPHDAALILALHNGECRPGYYSQA